MKLFVNSFKGVRVLKYHILNRSETEKRFENKNEVVIINLTDILRRNVIIDSINRRIF
jgi:hypothetical protein